MVDDTLKHDSVKYKDIVMLGAKERLFGPHGSQSFDFMAPNLLQRMGLTIGF